VVLLWTPTILVRNAIEDFLNTCPPSQNCDTIIILTGILMNNTRPDHKLPGLLSFRHMYENGFSA
jgi:hypothetical protein